MGDRFGADDGRRAGAVLDDDGLTQRFAHGAADKPREIVGSATRRIRHHHPDRPIRIGRLREAAAGSEEPERGGAGEQVAAVCVHRSPPGRLALFCMGRRPT